VIEMGVGEQQHVDGFGIDGAALPVAVLKRALLEEAGVDEDAKAAGFEEMAGAGDLPVSAEESEFHRHRLAKSGSAGAMLGCRMRVGFIGGNGLGQEEDCRCGGPLVATCRHG
jgi:hypothetical protein